MRQTQVIKRKADLIEQLLDNALYSTIIGEPHARTLQRCVERGEELPEHIKPGGLITQLPPEMRKMLETVTAKDFDHRIDSIIHIPTK